MNKNARNTTAVIALYLSVVAAILIVVCALGCVWGSSSVGISDLFSLIAGSPIEPKAENILLNIRIPRVAAAALAGCALAVSGAIIQAVLDNPLASPNVVGINAGAGLAVLVCAAIFPGMSLLTPVAAFIGALVSAGLVLAISFKTGSSRLVVVLAGMALTTMFGAGMNLILIVNPDAYVGSSTFLVGGFSGVVLSDLIVPACCILAGITFAFVLTRKLNILSLGDDTAHSLGVNVVSSRIILLVLAALLASAAVSFAGLLGFVGLVVPHLVRMILGSDNRIVLPASALTGAVLVVFCDLFARVAFAPYEIPVGICMAMIGGPFFLFLILKMRRMHV